LRSSQQLSSNLGSYQPCSIPSSGHARKGKGEREREREIYQASLYQIDVVFTCAPRGPRGTAEAEAVMPEEKERKRERKIERERERD
jgi:hypothetical protein